MKIFRARFFWGFVVGFIAGPVAFMAYVYGYNRIVGQSTLDKIKVPVLPMASEADYDWTLETLAGEPFHFSTLKGKVVFLTVWRAGCEFCEAELPFLQNLYDQTREDGIAFITVALKRNDRILDLVAEHDLTFPIYIVKGDRPKMYKTGIIPSTFILSPEGKLAFRFRGPARWDDDTCAAFMRGLARGEGIRAAGIEEEGTGGG